MCMTVTHTVTNAYVLNDDYARNYADMKALP